MWWLKLRSNPSRPLRWHCLHRWIVAGITLVMLALAAPAQAATSVAIIEDTAVALSNPCNGETVVVTGTYILQTDPAGQVTLVTLAGAKGTGSFGGQYTVAYVWNPAGERAFTVNYKLLSAGSSFTERDLFLFDEAGLVSRVMIEQTCR